MKQCPKCQQYVINDLIVENDGKTSQIDHIVINPRGVFVIETKGCSNYPNCKFIKKN